MFPGGLLYYGVHLLMGSLVALSGDLALQATQYAMGILTALSPLLVFRRRRLADRIQARRAHRQPALCLTGFVWFGSVFDAGLYANFYGILSILLLSRARAGRAEISAEPGPLACICHRGRERVRLALLLRDDYPRPLALPVAVFLVERKLRWPALAISAVAIFPGLVGAALRPDLVAQLFAVHSGSSRRQRHRDYPALAVLSGVARAKYRGRCYQRSDDRLVSGLCRVRRLRGNPEQKSTRLDARSLAPSSACVAPFSGIAWRFSYMAAGSTPDCGFLWPRPVVSEARRTSAQTEEQDAA